MKKLPIDLHFEIEKFLKNKYECLIMYCLTDGNMLKFKKRELLISYICTSLELLKWYVNNNFKLNKNIFKYVSKIGILKNMKWLKKNNCPWDEHTFRVAAQKGILKNMKWLK
jgi:hypothetical protein